MAAAPADQAEARAWASQFLNAALHQINPLRYTVLPHPERPPKPLR